MSLHFRIFRAPPYSKWSPVAYTRQISLLFLQTFNLQKSFWITFDPQPKMEVRNPQVQVVALVFKMESCWKGKERTLRKTTQILVIQSEKSEMYSRKSKSSSSRSRSRSRSHSRNRNRNRSRLSKSRSRSRSPNSRSRSKNEKRQKPEECSPKKDSIRISSEERKNFGSFTQHIRNASDLMESFI